MEIAKLFFMICVVYLGGMEGFAQCGRFNFIQNQILGVALSSQIEESPKKSGAPLPQHA